MFTIKPGIRADMESSMIGPNHDPYGALHIKINAGSNGSADLYTDGLGTCKAQFWSDFDDQNPARVIEWNGCSKDHRQMMLKANILARRTIGVSFDEVEAYVHNMPGDSMGPASRYM